MLWTIYAILLVLATVILFGSSFVKRKEYAIILPFLAMLLFGFLAAESVRIGVLVCQ